MADSKLLCANSLGPDGHCLEHGQHECSGCRLVKYCGRDCQVKHWHEHKKYCKSPLMKTSWRPSWAAEGRQPEFIGGLPQVHFGGLKYVWGNVPALDILQLAANEGENYDGDLRLLFAASGDLRNVVKTLSSIPSTFSNSINVTLNDRDLDIVARNAILLLIAVTSDDIKEAVDCMLHVWYSALIRQNHQNLLHSKVRGFIDDINKKIASKPPQSLQAKTWTFGSCRLRLVLTKEAWAKMLQFLDVPESLITPKADEMRRAITLAPQRIDYRERQYFQMRPAHRVCQERFRQDGILLPFGSSRELFTVPNPTLFQNGQGWPLKDSANPLEGWNITEVMAKSLKCPRSDIYGKMFSFVHDLLEGFVERVKSLNLSFELYNVNAQELPLHLELNSFDRIEVSNICDSGYLGCAATLAYLGPLLQRNDENPHATFIMLFMNAVREVITKDEHLMEVRKNTIQAMKYLPMTSLVESRHDPILVRSLAAKDHFFDFDRYFTSYQMMQRMEECGQLAGLKMKDTHSIVEKWPLRLKKQPGQPGAQEEFDLLFESGHYGHERYVEWKCN